MTLFVTVLLICLVFKTPQFAARYIPDPFGGDIEDLRGDSDADPLFDENWINAEEEEMISSKCAYTTTGGIAATPLSSCWAFEQTQTAGYTFSYDFTTNGYSLNWNYYNDLDCKDLSSSTTMSAIHNSDGLGTNCQTVEITKTGSYYSDSDPDECEVNENTASDWFKMIYVVNECYQTAIDGQDVSAMLLCDDEKLYFNTYPKSMQCQGKGKQYIYHYYDDNDCWDIQCNSVHQELIVMEDASEDPQRIKRYLLYGSVMIHEQWMNSQTVWIYYIVFAVLVSLTLVGMYCYYSMQNKDGIYTRIS